MSTDEELCVILEDMLKDSEEKCESLEKEIVELKKRVAELEQREEKRRPPSPTPIPGNPSGGLSTMGPWRPLTPNKK